MFAPRMESCTWGEHSCLPNYKYFQSVQPATDGIVSNLSEFGKQECSPHGWRAARGANIPVCQIINIFNPSSPRRTELFPTCPNSANKNVRPTDGGLHVGRTFLFAKL